MSRRATSTARTRGAVGRAITARWRNQEAANAMKVAFYHVEVKGVGPEDHARPPPKWVVHLGVKLFRASRSPSPTGGDRGRYVANKPRSGAETTRPASTLEFRKGSVSVVLADEGRSSRESNCHGRGASRIGSLADRPPFLPDRPLHANSLYDETSGKIRELPHRLRLLLRRHVRKSASSLPAAD